MIESCFRVSERGSTVPRELRGGPVTVHPLTWVVAVAFVAFFAVGPIRAFLAG